MENADFTMTKLGSKVSTRDRLLVSNNPVGILYHLEAGQCIVVPNVTTTFLPLS